MAFINEIYRFQKIFRDIEKAIKKCVLLNGAIEYITIHTIQGYESYYYFYDTVDAGVPEPPFRGGAGAGARL